MTNENLPDEAGPDGIEPLLEEVLEARMRGDDRAVEGLLDAAGAARTELEHRMEELQALGLLESASEGPDTPMRLGRYRIGRTLGAGGMGVVHAAVDEEVGREVAIKILPPERAFSETGRERFRREIAAVGRLNHPSVVPIYDVGAAGSIRYFTMELVEGESLQDRIDRFASRGTAPADAPWGVGEVDDPIGRSGTTNGALAQALRWIIETAEALHHAHEASVVHRDVKPSNILVNPEGRAKLCDFGLAQLAEESRLTRTGDVSGTPYALAPEQIDPSLGAVDRRTDVYALGTVLYELLTLRPPFRGRTAAEVMRRIEQEDAPSVRRANPRVSVDLETVCLKALEKDPRRRYASAAAFAADLWNVVAGRAIQARPVSVPRRAWAQVRRRPVVAALASAALLIAVAGPLAWFAMELRAERSARRGALRTAAVLEAIIFDADVEELGPEAPVRVLLDVAVEAVRRELSDQPVVQGRLLQKLGAYFLSGGEAAKGGELLQEALTVQLEVHGERSTETAATLNFLGNFERRAFRFDDALRLYGRARDANDRAPELDPSLAIQIRNNISGTHMRLGSFDRALASSEDAIRIADDSGLPSEVGVVCSRFERAAALAGLGRTDEAATAFEYAMDSVGEGENSLAIASHFGTYGRFLRTLRRYGESFEAFERQRDAFVAAFPAPNEDAAASRYLLAEVYWVGGERAQAVREADLALRAYEGMEPGPGSRLNALLFESGGWLVQSGRAEEGTQRLRRLWESSDRGRSFGLDLRGKLAVRLFAAEEAAGRGAVALEELDVFLAEVDGPDAVLSVGVLQWLDWTEQAATVGSTAVAGRLLDLVRQARATDSGGGTGAADAVTARIERALGRPGAALSAARAARERLEPGPERWRFNELTLARLALDAGRPRVTLDRLEPLLDDPRTADDEPDAWTVDARCAVSLARAQLAEFGRAERALEDARRAAEELPPTDGALAVHATSVQIELERGDVIAARRSLDAAVLWARSLGGGERKPGGDDPASVGLDDLRRAGASSPDLQLWARLARAVGRELRGN
ncbi:MAG: serine/threonine-protein kinase [Planctomycetota bacterium]